MTRYETIQKLWEMVEAEENFNDIQDIVLEWNFHHSNDEIFLSTCLTRNGDVYDAVMIEDDVIEVTEDYAEGLPEC